MDIDSQSTLLREVIKARYAKLNIIPKTHGFGCPYLEDCSRKSKERGTKFHTGNWAYIGINYGNALIDGKNARILIVAMDRGGKGGADEEEFPDTQWQFRKATENPTNPHMGGVSLIIKELVDAKDSLVYSNQYAFTNAVKCSVRTESMHTGATAIMIYNCSHHLAEEINALAPRLLITQGTHPANTVKRLFGLVSSIAQFSSPEGRISELFKAQNMLILTTPHPARLKGMRWRKGILPDFMAQALQRTRYELLNLSS